MKHQSDVAERATERRSAGAAVERRRDATAVQQQNRLPALLLDRPKLLQERSRERVPGLAAQVDDPHARKRASQPPPQLESVEALPTLGPRRRTAVDRDRALEGSALRGNGARVVARIGFLLVGLIVLLVHADDADVAQRRKDRRTRADDEPRLSSRDALPLVPALCVGQA